MKNIPMPDSALLEEVLKGCSRDPHAVLGIHRAGTGICIYEYDPEALDVMVLVGEKRYPAVKVHADGLFACFFPHRKKTFAYRVEKKFEHSTFVSADPYCYLPSIGSMDTYLFNQGEHHKVYDVIGAHIKEYDGVRGTSFTVWAPNAKRVSVVGDFNNWDGRRHPMRLLGNSGIWEIFIPGVQEGDLYKFEVYTCRGDIVLKLDPYAQRIQKRPDNAGIVWHEKQFHWTDEKWMAQREAVSPVNRPMNTYEVHLGTWGGPGLKLPVDKEQFNQYCEIAISLAKYVKEMGYTHVELLPIMEHPLDISWGYQVTGYYAPTSRYGLPEDFAWFVNYMHNQGIGVILDWVPAHFPKDSFGLGRFDGTALYEHEDPRQGEQQDWGTYVYNFGRNEVRTFLIGSALYWMDHYHVDGLRVDAVASMIYLSFSRKEGEWIPNKFGGSENLEAIAFLQRLNELTHSTYPGTVMIAEESSCYPGVSRPVFSGGLGFTFKWNMGWMHDTLDYFALDPIVRKYHHGRLNFSICYAFTENFVLPFSHDEVVHGKLSLFGRMSGDYLQKFANLRAMFVYLMTHPGKKLMFMGGEFAQVIEWNCNFKSVDWLLLKYPTHDAFHHMVAALNHFYTDHPALWEDDFSPDGFQWLEVDNNQESIYAFIRWDEKRVNPVVVVFNLTPVVRENYRVGVPYAGGWTEAFSTDRFEYNGNGLLNEGILIAEEVEHQNQHHCLILRLPGLSALILTRTEKSAPKTIRFGK